MHFPLFFLMSNGMSQALQLLAGLSLLITLHEFGHFFFARMFKTRVEKFYLFFDFLFPFSGLLNFSLFKKKVGETEYGIGWFPLGGYVKIAGMIDESMDKEALALPPEPWEYRSKKPHQRLFIMLGGIIFNVITAMVIYMFVFGIWGEKYLPVGNARFGVVVDSVGESIGLRSGDKILNIDGEPVKRFNDIIVRIILHKDGGTIGVNRDGKDTVIRIPDGTITKITKATKGSVIMPRVPTVIDSVRPGTIASSVHLQKNDSIISVNGAPSMFKDQFDNVKKASFGMPMRICFVRAGVVDSVEVTVPKDSSVGFFTYGILDQPERYFHFETVTYNPLQAVVKGFTYTYDRFVFYIQQFKLFGSKEVKLSESLGGFGSIASLYSPVFDLHDFLMFTAFISIALAFMNLLPIPGLDGGYVLFLLYEIISGRKVSEKVMERTTSVGLVILLALMLYANGLDIFRHFFKH